MDAIRENTVKQLLYAAERYYYRRLEELLEATADDNGAIDPQYLLEVIQSELDMASESDET